MQGFNMGRYYPPDASNPPRFNSTHPLGARAKKLPQGILTVRFELPFAVWCDTCKPAALIGQGVRFNAEKKKVGNYHSTPIWSFRMKHTACGGWWEIRTDPKSAEYVVVEGARRRDYGPGEGGGEEGELQFLTEEERERRREDAFARFEGKVGDTKVERSGAERVEELYGLAEVWRDSYDVNARLRREFRGKRKEAKREERYKEGLQEKYGLGIEILGAEEEDGVRAGMVEFRGATTADTAVEEVTRRPLFVDEKEAPIEMVEKPGKLKAEVKAEKSRHDLQKSLVTNTRAAIDPFLAKGARSAPKTSFGILKRKREASPGSQDEAASTPAPSKPINPPEKPSAPPAIALVDYDSD